MSTYRPPRTCTCRKNRYPDEQAALADADRLGLKFETSFRVYKCPGASVWHLRTRGFRPESLRSQARILAWHIQVRRVIDRSWLYQEVGAGRGSSAGRHAGKALRAFERLGLLAWDDPRYGYVRATDDNGLSRVMAIGLAGYAAEQEQESLLP